MTVFARRGDRWWSAQGEGPTASRRLRHTDHAAFQHLAVVQPLAASPIMKSPSAGMPARRPADASGDNSNPEEA